MRSKSISNELFNVLKDLQKIQELEDHFLVGGTNLAMRYDHRVSVDIDYFTDNYFSIDKTKRIELALKRKFGTNLLEFKYYVGSLNKPYLIQARVKEKDEKIKIDLVDWCLNFYKIERIKNIPLMDVRDVGFLKLASMCGRGSIKDAYDLNVITEEIPLIELWNLRNEIFDKNDLLNGKRILDPTKLGQIIPSGDKIEHMPGFPSEEKAKLQWIEKVKELLKKLG